MKKFDMLDRQLLSQIKSAFVAMPAGADPSAGADPVAGGGMMTQAQAAPMGGGAPMDPSMGGGAPMDPAMAGGMPPMDPAAMGGGAPADPAAAGGMPPMDPSMMGGMPAPTGQINLTPQEFIELVVALQGSGKSKPKAQAAGAAQPAAGGSGGDAGGGNADISGKLDQLISIMSGMAGSGGMPPQGGGQPPAQ